MAAERPRALTGAHAASWRKLLRLTARESRVWRGAAGYITLTRVHQQELEDRFGMRANAAVIPDGVRLDPAPHAAAAARRRRRSRSPTPATSIRGRASTCCCTRWRNFPQVQARIVGGQPGETDHVRLDAPRARRLASPIA